MFFFFFLIVQFDKVILPAKQLKWRLSLVLKRRKTIYFRLYVTTDKEIERKISFVRRLKYLSWNLFNRLITKYKTHTKKNHSPRANRNPMESQIFEMIFFTFFFFDAITPDLNKSSSRIKFHNKIKSEFFRSNSHAINQFKNKRWQWNLF